MRVGFFFWPYPPEYTERMARLGEEHGFDIVGSGDTAGNAMDPWVAMTLAASVTSRIRLATCVTNLVTRHPSVTASAAASVDVVSGGRSVLGIGAGHSGVANVGSAPAGPSSLREGLILLRAALSGRPVSWRGATTHLPWVRRPVPVYAAASGPQALRAAGAAADGAFVNYGLGGEEVRHARGLIEAGAKEAGRTAAEGAGGAIAWPDVSARPAPALGEPGNIPGSGPAYTPGPAPERRRGPSHPRPPL